MALNFSQMLMEAKRKAQLAGRPLTRQETSGIAEGYASSASERLARAKTVANQEKGLSLEEERIKQQNEQFKESLEQRKVEQLAQMDAASHASAEGKRQSQATGAVTGAAIGGYMAAGTAMGGPVGAGLGLVAGFLASSGSWLCTEAKRMVDLDEEDIAALRRFRAYVLEHHKIPFLWYLERGSEIVKAIDVGEFGNTNEFYRNLKKNMIRPIVVKTDSGHLEEAYELYRDTVLDVLEKYTPWLSNDLKFLLEVDEKSRRAA